MLTGKSPARATVVLSHHAAVPVSPLEMRIPSLAQQGQLIPQTATCARSGDSATSLMTASPRGLSRPANKAQDRVPVADGTDHDPWTSGAWQLLQVQLHAPRLALARPTGVPLQVSMHPWVAALQLYAAAGLHLSDESGEFSSAGGQVAIADMASTQVVLDAREFLARRGIVWVEQLVDRDGWRS
ncbi:hypothetical protein BC828DRAFT_170759 [Blastocladiella britannica]|nr:hypothetical protein BC828DRAFT_170759 [Blastocladiella britannica]